MSKELTTQTKPPASFLEMVERASRDPAVDVAKMASLMEMLDKREAREAERSYSDAMNQCQSEMRPVSQDASNPQTRSKYASYGALDNALRPTYSRHGFALSFDTAFFAPEGCVRVVCKVSHRDGHSERPHLDMPNDGKGAKGGDVMTKTHATMSAVSYARRGLLKMVFNISEGEFDDDGNGATVRGPSGVISTEQRDSLAKIIEDNGFPIDAFCKWAGVETLADIPAANYAKAFNALQAKVKAKGGK